MSVSSSRTQTTVFSGDVVGTEIVAALVNNLSPGMTVLQPLTLGFNAISVPTSGSIPTALTIIPFPGNAVSLIIKGVTGDTGIRINNIDPTSIALDPSVSSIGITAGAACNVRLQWS